jgi:hypothetical protein
MADQRMCQTVQQTAVLTPDGGRARLLEQVVDFLSARPAPRLSAGQVHRRPRSRPAGGRHLGDAGLPAPVPHEAAAARQGSEVLCDRRHVQPNTMTGTDMPLAVIRANERA